MRKSMKALAVAAVLAAGIAAAPALFAHDWQGSRGSMTGPGMMGQEEMMGSGMMGMMGQMSQLMETCNEMMQSVMESHGLEEPDEE